MHLPSFIYNKLQKFSFYWYDGLRLYEKKSEVRPMIKFIKKHFNSDEALTGVEIGVLHGHNACNILSHLTILKIFLIDPYANGSYTKDSRENKVYSMAQKNISRYKDKTVLIRKYSDDAADDIPLVDFIYIDGDHSEKAVKSDIKLYWNKVKPGGVFGGHDFHFRNMGVINAVLDFVKNNNLNLNVEGYDWWVVKEATPQQK